MDFVVQRNSQNINNWSVRRDCHRKLHLRIGATKLNIKIENLKWLKQRTVKGRMIELSVLWGILWKSGYLDITVVWHETGNLAKFDIFNLDSFRFVISPVRFLAIEQPGFWTISKWMKNWIGLWGWFGYTWWEGYEAIDIFLGDWTCSSCPQIPILGRNEDSFSEGLLRGPQDLDRPP